MIDAKVYIDQFNVLGIDDEINCENLSKILYGAILSKFKISITKAEYVYFKEYQERVFDLVENLRELDTDTIVIVLEYLDKVNCYLVDIIIMLWCCPRTDAILSERIYKMTYKKNIKNYNYKITKNIKHYTIKNFCVETLIKSNNVPVHCIDYLWYYLDGITLEFAFTNSKSYTYIGISIPDDQKSDNREVLMSFNMELLLEIGLGKVVYDNNESSRRGSFSGVLEKICTDITIVREMIQVIPTKNNYKFQLNNISKDPAKYFGEHIRQLPMDIINEIK